MTKTFSQQETNEKMKEQAKMSKSKLGTEDITFILQIIAILLSSDRRLPKEVVKENLLTMHCI